MDYQDERSKGYQADTPEPAVTARHHMCSKDSPPAINLRRPLLLTLIVLILGTALTVGQMQKVINSER